MLPIRSHTPTHFKPWANWLLIVANVAVMVLEALDPSLLYRREFNETSLRLSSFLTYAFLHVGYGHLIFNMVALYILGNNINDRLGHVGYLAFYLGGAVCSAIGYLITGGQAIVGASGAVGAIMGAYLVLLPKTNITLFVGVGWLEVPSMYFVIIFFCYNLMMSVAVKMGMENVAYQAHIAGMLYGFLVTLGLLATNLIPRDRSDFLSLIKTWKEMRHRAELS